MGTVIVIAGDTGSGKSSSMCTLPEIKTKGLNPKYTRYVNVLNKHLPMRDSLKVYNKVAIEVKKADGTMSIIPPKHTVSRDYNTILLLCINTAAAVEKQANKAFEIVIDDFSYIMSIELMLKMREKGFEKFIAAPLNIFQFIEGVKLLPDDIIVYLLAHTEVDEHTGKTKMKTSSKFIDKEVKIDSLFEIIIYAEKHIMGDSVEYKFRTASNGEDTCKTPVGMFSEKLIANDLDLVSLAVREYYGLAKPKGIATQTTPTTDVAV